MGMLTGMVSRDFVPGATKRIVFLGYDPLLMMIAMVSVTS